jgi:SAM-dependent methyltransferase
MYGFLRLADIALRTGWEALGMRVLHFLGRRPGCKYGWFEALLSPARDYWFRYAEVIAALKSLAPAANARLIEVASGRSGGMAWALGRQDSGICLVDYSVDFLRDARGRGTLRVCADGCRLPFPDNTFDAAVSLDTLEHLPRTARPIFIAELKRVAKRGVGITCPLESADGLFQARKPDSRLSAVIAKRSGVQPGWLQEHLQQGHPTREELLESLPGAKVTGSDNCGAWLRFAVLQQRLFLWPFSGLFYLLSLRKQDSGPPYRQALLVWQKPSVARDSVQPGDERAADAEYARIELGPPESQVTSPR